MPTITDLRGPAGFLEAILERACTIDSVRYAARRRGICPPPSAAWGNDAHQGGVSGDERIGSHRMRRPAVQFSRCRQQRGCVRERRRREGRFPRGARLHGREIPGCAPVVCRILVWSVGRPRSRRRRQPGVSADRHRPAGRDLGVGDELHLSKYAGEYRSRSSSSRERPTRSALSRGCGAFTRSSKSQRNWSSSTPPITCSKGRLPKSVKRWKSCWPISKVGRVRGGRGIAAGTHAGPVARQPTFLKRARGVASGTRASQKAGARRAPPASPPANPACSNHDSRGGGTSGPRRDAASALRQFRKTRCRWSDRRRRGFATDARNTRTPN